jgi:hypothetical protein
MVAYNLLVLSKYEEIDGVRTWSGTPEEKITFDEYQTQSNLQTLWQSATDWQEQFISNAAYGLLTIGVIQSKPKSLACMAWIQTIWAKYYEQKSLVTHEYEGVDFSVVGPMPYTVPELTAEVLGV